MKPEFIYIRGVKCYPEVYYNGQSFIPMVATEDVRRWRGFAGAVYKTEEAAWNFFDLASKEGLLPTDRTGFPDETTNTQEAKKEVA